MKRKHYKLALAARKVGNAKVDSENHEDRGWTRKTIANVIVVGEDYVHYSDNHACHAGLDGVVPERRVATVSLTQKRDKSCSKEEQLMYMEWLLNDSPYSSVFSTKCAETAVKKGIITGAEFPSNLLAGGLIASRLPTEYGDLCHTWATFVVGGVCPRIAFLLCHVMIVKDGCMVHHPTGSHTAIDGSYLTKEAANNFVAGVPKHLNSLYSKRSNYTGVCDTWGPDNSNWLSQRFRKIDLGGTVKNNNPFKQVDTLQTLGEVGLVVDHIKTTWEYYVKP